MKWSWRIGRIAGIDVYVHLTMLILLVFVGASYYLQRHRWEDVGAGLAFIVALFTIVVLHELGHALTARRFGIRTREITLLPIGGVARLERMPEDPRQEMLVALAGPAVNFVLAAALFLMLAAAETTRALGGFAFTGSSLLANLIWINVALAVFNLIPAFPMDGGRVLRAWLATRMDHLRATQTAATVGQGIAFAFGFVGLFTNPFLVFIALFVWMGAAAESSTAQMRSALGGIPVSRAMITQFRTLEPDHTLAHALECILSGFQQDFPVVEGGRLVGVLTRHDLLARLPELGGRTPVRDVMRTRFETADPSEMLDSAFTRLRTCDCRALPVVRSDQVVGILTMDNLGEFLMSHPPERSASRRAAKLLE